MLLNIKVEGKQTLHMIILRNP